MSWLGTVTLTCAKLWSDLLCRMLQQYYCSAATQAEHDNLVNHTDLTAEVPLRILKHVNSMGISTLARQKMPLSLKYSLYWLNWLREARKPFCFFKCVGIFLSVLQLWPTTFVHVFTFMLLYINEISIIVWFKKLVKQDNLKTKFNI